MQDLVDHEVSVRAESSIFAQGVAEPATFREWHICSQSNGVRFEHELHITESKKGSPSLPFRQIAMQNKLKSNQHPIAEEKDLPPFSGQVDCEADIAVKAHVISSHSNYRWGKLVRERCSNIDLHSWQRSMDVPPHLKRLSVVRQLISTSRGTSIDPVASWRSVQRQIGVGPGQLSQASPSSGIHHS